MKVSIDIDLTPEELRQVLGLPDVAQLQQQLIAQVQQQMEDGVEGYDPASLLKPYMASGLGSMDALQKMLLGAMASGISGGTKKSS